MAFTNTVTSAGINSSGDYFEEGTWDGAGVTTGSIVAGAGIGFPTSPVVPKIIKIERFNAKSNGDTAILFGTTGLPNSLEMTFTIGDAGKYRIEGPAA